VLNGGRLSVSSMRAVVTAVSDRLSARAARMSRSANCCHFSRCWSRSGCDNSMSRASESVLSTPVGSVDGRVAYLAGLLRASRQKLRLLKALKNIEWQHGRTINEARFSSAQACIFLLTWRGTSAMPFAASSLRASACVCGMFVRRCPELPTAYYNRSEVAKCISNAQNAQNSCATPAGFTPGVQTLAAQ